MRSGFIAITSLLLCVNMLLADPGKAQSIDNVRVTIGLQEEPLLAAIKKIENLTRFRFAYVETDIAPYRQLSLPEQSRTVKETLDALFQETGLTYKVNKNSIGIIERKKGDDKSNHSGPAVSEEKQNALLSRLGNFRLQVVSPNAPAKDDIVVRGTVTDDKGSPLSGVSVLLKGTSKGVFTGNDGSFSIEVPGEDAILVISYVGFIEQEVTVGKNRSLSILLTASGNNRLDSVVVVAYGTQKRNSITAAVSTISGKDISKQPVANLSNAIAGRTAGVIVTQGNGEPGQDGSSIFIRGIGTTGSNTQPLIIVDGVPRSFGQLDPNSIASFTILKDAAAVAPYGMGGANGVILVTTKRGLAGTPSLAYNGYVGWQNPTRLADFVNSYEYATLFNAANANEGRPPAYSEYHLQKYKDGSDPDGHPNHDVLDELITRNTVITNHNLSLSGGGEKVKYFAAMGYLRQAGMWGPSYFNRYNLTANIDAQATNTTKLSLSINGIAEDRNQTAVSTNFMFYQAFRTPPISPLRFSNGLWGSHIGRTAYGNIHHSGYAKTLNYTMLSQIALEQQLPFIKGLSVKAVVSYDFTPNFGRLWSTPIPFYSVDTTKNPYVYTQAGNDGPAKPAYQVSYQQNQAFTYQGYITYNRSFGNHDIGVLGVVEARNTKYNQFVARRANYNVLVPELNNGSSNSTDISNSGFSAEAKQRSVLYRVSYGFMGKYLFETSGRYDGNYYFAPGKRFGFFPSFSAGWRISEEDFMAGVSWIDNLKLRGSYGESGALAGSAFQYLSSYALAGNAAILGGTAVQGLSENAEPNTAITWERAKKTNIGVEATLWRGLLTIEADYFMEKRSNMLLAPNVIMPAEYGIGLSQINSGRMSNRGFELTLGSTYTINKDWRVAFTGNITYAKNKLEQVYENLATYNNPNRRLTGRALGTQFGYKAIGYFQVADDKDGNGIVEVAESGLEQPWGVVRPGDLKYQDMNGDGKITPDDIVEIGNPATPQLMYGFSPSVSYKGFDLVILFQGAGGRNFYLDASAAWPFVNGASALRDNLDYWTPTNTNAPNPRITTQPTANNTAFSSWWIRSGRYLRLKTGELGYTFDGKLLRKVKMQSARLFVSGQNLLTWSPIKNFDPEVSVTNGEYYPQQKVVSVGLNVTF